MFVRMRVRPVQRAG